MTHQYAKIIPKKINFRKKILTNPKSYFRFDLCSEEILKLQLEYIPVNTR
jgi:hypothetical protein